MHENIGSLSELRSASENLKTECGRCRSVRTVVASGDGQRISPCRLSQRVSAVATYCGTSARAKSLVWAQPRPWVSLFGWWDKPGSHARRDETRLYAAGAGSVLVMNALMCDPVHAPNHRMRTYLPPVTPAPRCPRRDRARGLRDLVERAAQLSAMAGAERSGDMGERLQPRREMERAVASPSGMLI